MSHIKRRVTQDKLLYNMQSSLKSITDKETMNITFKKDISDRLPKKSPGRLNKLRNQLSDNAISEIDKNDKLLLRYKINKKNQNSAVVKKENILNYVNQFLNLSNLYLFKKKEVKKQVKLPTKKDSESKRTKKRNLRLKMIKDKKEKEKKIKLQKKQEQEKLFKLAKNIK